MEPMWRSQDWTNVFPGWTLTLTLTWVSWRGTLTLTTSLSSLIEANYSNLRKRKCRTSVSLFHFMNEFYSKNVNWIIIMLMELWDPLPPKSTVGLPGAQEFRGAVVFLSVCSGSFCCCRFLQLQWFQVEFLVSPSNDADRNRYFTSFSTSPIKTKQQY